MSIHQQRHKPMFSITIEKDVLETFNYYAKKHSVNKSLLIENYLINWLKEKEPEAFKELENKLKDLDDFIKT